MNQRPNSGVALPLITIVGLVGFALLFSNRTKPAVPSAPGATESLRLGYFPNVTHAPALVGVARGEFQRALGGKVSVDPKVFNAGPEAMEALLAGAVDVAYVGPSPAINTFLKSKGSALRILAGACSGGAALVAREGTTLSGIRDLSGRRVAVPQLGGTQDVSLRHFLAKEGLKPREKGGTVEILPIKNPDILALFLKGELDAAWVPEPWATRLLHEAKARLVVDERDLWPSKKFTTTVVVARKAYLDQHAEQVQALLQAHLRALEWLQKNPDAGQTAVNAELKRLTGKALPEAVLKESWGRVAFTADPNPANIQAFVQAASEAGYLPPQGVNVAALLDLHPLENVQRRASAAR
jgi:NitT/TauT family transport system substrate-binding protein